MQDFPGGPSTVVALFSYGGVVPQTHRALLRDAVFASGVTSALVAEDRVIGALENDDRVWLDSSANDVLREQRSNAKNWPLVITHPHQDALIERSRALCAKQFLEQTDAEVLIMLDHDLEWQGARPGYEGDLCHIARQCAATKGIVGACVSKKTRGQGVACMWKEPGEHDLGSVGLVPVHYMGAAFTAYHRDALQAVSDTMDDVPPGFRPIFGTCVVDHPNAPDQRLHLSEDWAFCHYAAQLNIPSYASLHPLIRHWGMYPYDVIGDAMYQPKDSPKRKISCIHATRGRPDAALATKQCWLDAASGFHEIEYIFSVDDDDEASDALWNEATTVEAHNRGNVDAYNTALHETTGDILVQVHDDITPPQDWDRLIAARLDPSKPQVLHCSDGTSMNPEKPWLVTVMVCTRLWAKKLGGLFYPGYISIYCDDDASQKAQKDGCIVPAPDIVFRHDWRGAEGDETYRRSYREENWEHGAALLEERKAAGFPDYSCCTDCNNCAQ